MLKLKTLLTEVLEENTLDGELRDLLGDIDSAAANAKPSPNDGQINELALTLVGLALSMPGLLNLLGKALDPVEKFLNTVNPSQKGKALQKLGKKWEHAYIDSISGWIKAAYPKKYKNQDPHDITSDLHDAAHGIYAAMLTGAALTSGFHAASAIDTVVQGLEGGAAAFKASEVVGLAKKIAAA